MSAVGWVAMAVAASVGTAQETGHVEVVDNAFEPTTVTVSAGGEVTWTHTGGNPHSVTADDGSFDSHPGCSAGIGCMSRGDTFSVTFDEPGSYAYYCRVHGAPGGVGMSGTVVVEPAAEEEQEDEPSAAEDRPATDPSEERDSAGPATADAGSSGTGSDVERDAGRTGELADTGGWPTAWALLAAAFGLLGLAARRTR